MTDLQWLAIGAPVALVVLVGAIVAIEEFVNQAEMKREQASKRNSAPAGYPGRMTVQFAHLEVGQDIDKAKRESLLSEKSRAG